MQDAKRNITTRTHTGRNALLNVRSIADDVQSKERGESEPVMDVHDWTSRV